MARAKPVHEPEVEEKEVPEEAEPKAQPEKPKARKLASGAVRHDH